MLEISQFKNLEHLIRLFESSSIANLSKVLSKNQEQLIKSFESSSIANLSKVLSKDLEHLIKPFESSSIAKHAKVLSKDLEHLTRPFESSSIANLSAMPENQEPSIKPRGSGEKHLKNRLKLRSESQEHEKNPIIKEMRATKKDNKKTSFVRAIDKLLQRKTEHRFQ